MSRNQPEDKNSFGAEACPESSENEFPKDMHQKVIVKCGTLELPIEYLTKEEFGKLFPHNLLDGFRGCNFFKPYGVQGFCFPHLFRKNDVIIHSANGTGKTVAALMTCLREILISKAQFTSKRAVVVCRTCESARSSFALLSRMTKFCPNIRLRLAIRGAPSENMKEEIIVGTPEKVNEMVNHLTKDSSSLLVVVDEVEAVQCDRGYFNSLTRALKSLKKEKLILLCAVPATSSIKNFVDKITSVDPCSLEFPFFRVKSKHQQIFVRCPSDEDLLRLIKKVASRKGQIVFICDNRDMCSDIYKFLLNANEKVAVLNGKTKDLVKRDKIKKCFKEGVYRVLVTTRNFANVTSYDLHTIVNCAVVLTNDGTKLDHTTYHKHIGFLSNTERGVLINAIDHKWADYAKGENGENVELLSVDNLQISS